MPEFVLRTAGNSSELFRNKTKKETGSGKNDQKKLNLLPDRRPGLLVDLNLLHQAIPSGPSLTPSDPRVPPDLGLTLSDPGVLSDLGQILSYLGVHQGLGQLYQEVLLDQTLPDREVL